MSFASVTALRIRSAAVKFLVVCAFACLAGVPGAFAQVSAPGGGPASGLAPAQGGAVSGTVTTQGGTTTPVPLGGAVVTLVGPTNATVGSTVTDGDGRFKVVGVAPGSYHLSVSLDGFVTKVADVAIVAGQTVTRDVDLAIAGISASVDVVARTAIVSSADTLSQSEKIGSTEREQLAPGSGVTGALKLLASVIEVPGGLSIKGGRPTQVGMQIGPIMFTDPSLGLAHINLPDDAIDSVSVLPNPYAVEYGRFSSGLVVIQTRRAGDTWKVHLNNLDPTIRTERYHDYKPIGISGFGPRVEVGGPVIAGRLYLEQAAQYRYSSDDVPSRPQNELQTTNWLSSFTRIDANLSAKHTLTATVGLFPKNTSLATLGTFTPPDATVDLHDRVDHAALIERAVWSDAVVSESSIKLDQFRTTLTPQGVAPMELWPDTTLGNFFNAQSRRPQSLQFVETLAGTYTGLLGLHLFKVGTDVLRTEYTGSSVSRPVLIYRADGTLARRLDFSGPTVQDVRSTDVALFAQDRLQPSPHWYVEYGARLDRDGVTARWNATPRVGAALLLNQSGTSVLRGGFGLFYERTPSVAGAFRQFEATTETRYAADGVTPTGLPVTYTHVVAPDLQTARSATWDLGYDYRVNPRWSFHVSFLDRRGSNELIVNPEIVGGAGELLLSSSGSSRYRNVEAGFEYTRGAALDLNVTYSRSIARSNLNAFANYFDTSMQPVINSDAYGPSPTDVPNRLFARGRLMPTPRWLLTGVLDWRTGFPYSVVDAALDFVGARNTLRFPNRMQVDLGIQRRFHIGRFQPWIGVDANNAFNSFLPADVQANVDSPNFGSFYNSPYRQFRLEIRFER